MVPFHPSGGGGRAESETDTPGLFAFCSSCVCSLLASILGLFVFYHSLVSLTQPLYVLSTTAIVVVFLTVWALLWMLLQTVLEWRAGRLSAA